MKIARIVKSEIKFVSSPQYRFLIMAGIGKYDQMKDDEYLIKKYRAAMKKELHLDAPITFNEKLQWLKLYDRKPEYTMMVDKYAVRQYIANTIGEEYLIPLLGVWDDPDEIDFDALPNQFVLKCNHNSGLGMCICKDKSKLNISKVKAQLRKGLKQNYYLTGREWPYKNVKPRIIAEKYMTDVSGSDLKDYKIFCFNGKPRLTLVCSERFSAQGLHEDFFDSDWNHLSFKRPDHPTSADNIKKPANFELMKILAHRLSENIPFVRTDFYEINGQVYFGELTFYPASGFSGFEPEDWDYKLGSWLALPSKYK